jgi:hypothetical protein
MLFALEGMCFFDAIADESRARLEVEFVNLSFSANAKAPKWVPFLRWRRRRDSLLCRSLQSKRGADNQAASRGSSLINASGADCSRGGSSKTSVVRSTKNACVLAPRGVEFKSPFNQQFNLLDILTKIC